MSARYLSLGYCSTEGNVLRIWSWVAYIFVPPIIQSWRAIKGPNQYGWLVKSCRFYDFMMNKILMSIVIARLEKQKTLYKRFIMYHCEMQFSYKLINFCAIGETNAFIYVYCVMIFDFNAYSFNVFII